MTTGNIRRAQLVSPFGVGAMSILVDGTSVITAGIDQWFPRDTSGNLIEGDFIEHDWRLEQRLRIRELRVPPDYRRSNGDPDSRNLGLTVPVLRFPRWSFCMYCKALKLSTLTLSHPEFCPNSECPVVKRSSKPARMSQVPFVAICPRGHMTDFPFDKWVHHSIEPACTGPLRLVARGGGSLEGQYVQCTKCEASRSLAGILSATGFPEMTTLSQRLQSGEEYLCEGSRPWLADDGSGCGEQLRGALRAAGNIYFPKVESSIYLPKIQGNASAEVLDLMNRADVRPALTALRAFKDAVNVDLLRQVLPYELFKPIRDQELLDSFNELFGVNEDVSDKDDLHSETLTSDEAWRFPEYELLRETPDHPFLTGTNPGIAEELSKRLARVRSIEVLRETRALRGFTRVRDSNLKLTEGKALLRRRTLPPDHDWLPAYVVKGEGLYLELESNQLSEWENRPAVQARAALIDDKYAAVALNRGMEPRSITPRLVLLHTLAHLLINELIFTCGYSSASLRERLYVGDENGREMAGILIYTAAGDSEGTMGGLVRMARPENLGNVFSAAIESAEWCSTDPVCMETGAAGQGPDSCNLAACHGCALLPETSCEEFNRFLDRGLVIGTLADKQLGFFSA